MIAENLLVQLAEHGFRVALNDGEAALVPVAKDARLPADLVRQVKKNKDKILALIVCDGCGRVTDNMEELRKLADCYAFCDRSKCQYKPQGYR